MKRIEAILRTNKLEEVKEALEDAGIEGMTCDPVRGYGRQQGRTDLYRGSTYALNLIPKIRIVTVVKDEDLEAALDAIIKVTRSGEVGDGKIFVSDVEDAIRIRTRERGESAIS